MNQAIIEPTTGQDDMSWRLIPQFPWLIGPSSLEFQEKTPGSVGHCALLSLIELWDCQAQTLLIFFSYLHCSSRVLPSVLVNNMSLIGQISFHVWLLAFYKYLFASSKHDNIFTNWIVILLFCFSLLQCGCTLGSAEMEWFFLTEWNRWRIFRLW